MRRKAIKFILDRLPPHLAARLDNWRSRDHAYPAMNGQIARLEFTREIILRCRIARIIETGTYRANTTRWFAQFGLPVVTSEIVPRLAELGKLRLRTFPNVEVRASDSVAVLRSLATEPIDRSAPTLFYLDAHWFKSLPLREEVELAVAHFTEAVLIIDDFAVPDDPGYGFDNYGPGKALNLDYLSRVNTPPLMIYFPVATSSQETGARRGSAILTANTEMAAILDGLPLLRRWKA